MTKFALSAILAAFLGGMVGCQRTAGTASDNYPYDMYEREFPKMMEYFKQGDSSGLTISEVTGLEPKHHEEEYQFLKTLYGKVKAYKVVKTIDCRLRRYWYVELELTNENTVTVRIEFWLYQGHPSVEIRPAA